MSLFDELNTIDDLEIKLISGELHESDSIEYKTAPNRMQQKDRDEAAKDISAFANASGGLLIYGVATADKQSATLPTGIEPLDPWNVNYLLLHARDAIRQPVPGIRTKMIQVGETHQVLMFEVPQSPLAPHQVITRHKYYRREGPKSIAMTHDLVELYFGRRMHPKLQPGTPPDFEPVPEGGNRYRVRISLHNVGGQIAHEVLTRIVVPKGMPAIIRADAIISIPGPDARHTTHGQSISHEHSMVLYYPGVPRPFVAVVMQAPGSVGGREAPLPSFYLDVYANESRPYRYRFFLSWTETMEEGAAPGKLNLLWEEVGLPPVIV